MTNLTNEQRGLVIDRLASDLEIKATIATFEARCWRGGSGQLTAATEAAHAALQAHLDAIAGSVATTKRTIGL